MLYFLMFFFQVMREVCVNGSVDFDGAGSGSPVHKNELEKVNTCTSDGIAIVFLPKLIK